MFKMLSARRIRREQLRVVESYRQDLMTRQTPVQPSETIEAHLAVLQLEDAVETRLRILQELAAMKEPRGIGPAVRELSYLGNNWPHVGRPELLQPVLAALVSFTRI